MTDAAVRSHRGTMIKSVPHRLKTWIALRLRVDDARYDEQVNVAVKQLEHYKQYFRERDTDYGVHANDLPPSDAKVALLIKGCDRAILKKLVDPAVENVEKAIKFWNEFEGAAIATCGGDELAAAARMASFLFITTTMIWPFIDGALVTEKQMATSLELVKSRFKEIEDELRKRKVTIRVGSRTPHSIFKEICERYENRLGVAVAKYPKSRAPAAGRAMIDFADKCFGDERAVRVLGALLELLFSTPMSQGQIKRLRNS